jgi:pre-rRNA-processing protein TSR4
MLMKLSNSVRAWRCVRFNKKYAEKLERKAARKKEQEQKIEKPAQQSGPKSNPFSVSARSDINWFGLTRGL